jgi:hypothetical protein
MFMFRTSVQTMKYAANAPGVYPPTSPPLASATVD